MTEEQTVTANTQVASEQKVDTEQQANDSATVQTEEQAVAPASSPEPAIPPEQTVATEAQPQSPPEKPRFFSGVTFFLWVFCTLVFLSITAGYIAMH